MGRARLVAALVPLLAAACAPARPRTELPIVAWDAPERLRVQVGASGTASVRTVPLEDYVAGTILSEFAPATGASAEIEQMFEVQAVISRTYAVMHLNRHGREGYDLCSTTHCQLYQPGRLRTSRWAEAATTAATRTTAAVVWYGNAPATTLYHADCGGRTSDASAVWGGRAYPYLTGVDDGGPAETAHSTWTYAAEADAVGRALERDPRTRPGAGGDIRVVERDAAGRATRIGLTGGQGTIVRADVFREVMATGFGPRAIRSTMFTIRRDAAGFHFDGRGFGHGVGLCQAGALARIRSGASPLDVLRRYYPGTVVVNVR